MPADERPGPLRIRDHPLHVRWVRAPPAVVPLPLVTEHHRQWALLFPGQHTPRPQTRYLLVREMNKCTSEAFDTPLCGCYKCDILIIAPAYRSVLHLSLRYVRGHVRGPAR